MKIKITALQIELIELIKRVYMGFKFSKDGFNPCADSGGGDGAIAPPPRNLDFIRYINLEPVAHFLLE